MGEARADLLARPPQAALDWATAAMGRGARLRRVRALGGSTSAALHVLSGELPSGARWVAVLRRYVWPELIALEPDLPERDARSLELLEATVVQAPQLIAADVSGEHVGAPAVLMTRLPGRVDVAPRNLAEWLHRAADVLPVIHSVDAPPDWPPYERYNIGQTLAPPAWTRRPGLWERAFALAGDAVPPHTPTFIHRDFHPGNLLWQRGRLTGVVDWVNSSVGPPQVDIGHCRTNLAPLFGVDVADRFATECAARGYDYDPIWDVICCVDRLPGGPSADSWQAFGKSDVALAEMRRRFEDLLARAVADL